MKVISWLHSLSQNNPLSNVQRMPKAYPMCWASFKNTAVPHTEVAFSSNMQEKKIRENQSKKVFLCLWKWTSKMWETMLIKEAPAAAKEIPLTFQQKDWKVFRWNCSEVIVVIHKHSVLHATTVLCDPVRKNSITGPVILMWMTATENSLNFSAVFTDFDSSSTYATERHT